MLKSPDPEKRARELLAARDRFYLEAAHVCVDTDGKTVEEIVEEILQKEETE